MPDLGKENGINDTKNSHTEKNRYANISIVQSIGMGSLAGAIEVAIDHPLWSIKTRLQRGVPFTLNPSVLYRGILANASSMVPVTAIQVTLNRCMHRYIFNDHPKLSSTQTIFAAFVAGVGSAFVSCPIEMIMTQQSKKGVPFKNALLALKQHGGFPYLWTGLLATGMREGIFTAFFLGVTPTLKNTIRPHCSSDYTASMVAGIGAGIGAAVISQGADTIKTQQQSAGLRLGPAVKQLYASRGWMGFFKGGLPRGLNVVSAVTIMGYVNEKMENALHQKGYDNPLVSEQNMPILKK